ncbi:MAG: hypothetical protein II557_06770 [Clostridia bacterium]|jgi:hypothetical protein|nr:hypothetical protein [Clostridia bacterium]MBQ2545976.1 hypothetical protein [Clostridia bacterium]MCR5681143.1 prealbumin-like fold domain-containing protein [Clostridiales bacterium]
MKKALSIILAVLMLASLAVAASANGLFFGRRIIPAIGKNTLTVTQEGTPVAGAEMNLWRDNPYGEDTLVGTYTTGKDGTVLANGLNIGNYYWQDGSENVKASFRITGIRGEGVLKSAIDIPASLSRTITFDDKEVTITVDLSGGYVGEINSYGTIYLYGRLGPESQICNGFVMDPDDYAERVKGCMTYDDKYEVKDGVFWSYTTGEYGSTTILFQAGTDVYYMLYVDNTADAEDVYNRVTVVGPRSESEGEDGREQMTYMSADGFQIRYNALEVESRDIDDHTAVFSCLNAPENTVSVCWIADKQPEEALYEITESWGDQEAILRTEGLFPGTTDKWGYWRTFSDENLVKGAIAGEYNGGVLVFVIESHLTGDDGKDMTISDTLSGIIDSITYFEFGEQTMYAYIPGVYQAADESGATYEVILNADHTGTLNFQDSVEVLWGSTELNAIDAKYAYTVEGDCLYIELGDDWVEFVRKDA